MVREEIRRTLIEELAELTDESRRAVQALGAMKRAAQLRGLLWSLSAVLLSTIIPGAVAYWLLPSTSEINALRERGATSSQASIQRLEQRGRPHRVAALR